MDVRVIQSYRLDGGVSWVERCLAGVRTWAEGADYDYEFLDDEELLKLLPDDFQDKLGRRWPMLVDLGRLVAMQRALQNGAERVIWLDADVWVCAPQQLQFAEKLEHGYAFGREVWVEKGGKVRHGVHNALCVFEKDNPLLDFYIHSCLRIVGGHAGDHWAPQLLGPKWLKLQHGLLRMPLLDTVAMWSPAVIEDYLRGGGNSLEKQLAEQGGQMPPAINLCSSMLDEKAGEQVVEKLCSEPSPKG